MKINRSPKVAVNKFDETNAIIAGKHGLEFGRMIAYSKSTYIMNKKNHQAIFNANIITSEGKIWWGDLDLTDDSDKLQAIADEIGKTLYILHEMDYRFNKENRPFEEVEKLAVKKFVPELQKQQQKKSSIQCLQSLASKVAQFFSVTRN